MREVVDRPENLRAPVGLEQRVLPERRVLVDAVLVGIEEVGLGIGGDRLGHALEREGRQLVVVVEQGDELTPGHRQGRVGVGRDAAVGLEECDAEPGVAGRPLHEHPAVFQIVGRRTGQAGLPVREGLRGERLQRADEELCLHAIDRDQHAHQRRSLGRRSGLRPVAERLPLEGHLAADDPRGILGRRRPHPDELLDGAGWRIDGGLGRVRGLDPAEPALRPRRAES